eukprot:GGOE01001483.1.p1 GENE.GGOE01001483.1~~GGOE01001483.1.p1  ORF type:complete len:1529 (-),score=383.42 GGOE01001483.1:271-4332(-)
MAAWPSSLLYSQRARVRMTFDGTALRQNPDGWRFSIGAADCAQVPTRDMDGPTVEVDTRPWAGLVTLCLGQQTTGATLSALVRVVDWALQPDTLEVGLPASLTVQGSQARSSAFVTILPASADCAEAASTAALRVDLTAALVLVPQIPSLPGEYQMCLRPYGEWGSTLAVNLTVWPANFHIVQPLSHLSGQAVITVRVAGSALTSASGVVFLTSATSCSLASSPDEQQLDANNEVQLDLSSLTPGNYQLCLVPVGAGSNDAWADTLQVVGLQSSPTLLNAASSQQVIFWGTLLEVSQAAIALLNATYTCADANYATLARALAVVTPRPNVSTEVDLSALLPGNYHWCLQVGGQYQEGYEVPVEVLPQEITLRPDVVLRSLKVEFQVGGWLGDAPVLSAQLVLNTTNCSTLLPAHLTSNPVVNIARGLPTVWMDFTDVAAGVYHFCLHKSLDSNGSTSNSIVVMDEEVSTLYVPRATQLLQFTGSASPWASGADIAALPWDRRCSTHGASAAVTAALTSDVSGIRTSSIDFSLVTGQDVRLCLRGTQWPYNVYQDGLELAVRIATFSLGSALYTQSPSIDLQAQGTALTGAGDYIAVFRSTNCLSGGALLRVPLGSIVSFTGLAAGSYMACLQPQGVPTAGLQWPFTLVGLQLSSSVAYAVANPIQLAGSAASDVTAYALLPRQYHCSDAPASLVQRLADGAVSFERYLPGDYQLCFRNTAGAKAAFVDGLSCPLQVLPALAVVPSAVSRSAAATIYLTVANVSISSGRAALIPLTQSCATHAPTSTLVAIPSATNASFLLDLSGASAGRYRVCYSPDGGRYSEVWTALLNVTALRWGTNGTVTATANASVSLSGCAVGTGAKAAVVMWRQTCATAASQSTIASVVTSCTVVLNLSAACCGWQRLCYREAGEAFQDGIELLLDVLALPLRYQPQFLLAGQLRPLGVQGQGLDLRPGHDAVRVVSNSSTCSNGSTFFEVTDFWPDNVSSSAYVSASLQLNSTGPAAVCYWRKETWQRLEPTLTVLPGVASFTGLQAPLLVANRVQTVQFTFTNAVGSTRRQLVTSDTSNITIAIASAALAAQSSSGGCEPANFVVAPTRLQGSQLQLTFPSAGGYVMCQQMASTWQPVAAFRVDNSDCGPSNVMYPCPHCRECEMLWIWLWPLILAVILGLLLVPCLWLLVRWRSATARQNRPQVAETVFHTTGAMAWGDLQDPLAEQMGRLAEDLRQSQRELKTMRTTSGPTEVRRIEVPVDRVVRVPVVEVRPREVVVERVVEVEVVRKVPKQITREVEKEVWKDTLVVDPATQRALEWARQDIELLKSELAAKTQELRDARKQLERMPPVVPALPVPPQGTP